MTLCVVYCVACFFIDNLRLSFPTKIKKNEAQISTRNGTPAKKEANKGKAKSIFDDSDEDEGTANRPVLC